MAVQFTAPRVLVQVAAGLVVTYLIYLAALAAMRSDRLSMDRAYDANPQARVAVVDGYVDSSSVQKRRYNTMQPELAGYLPIVPSVNRRGGAQFTYSLWLYVGQPEACADACIFLRGDPDAYSHGVRDNRAAGGAAAQMTTVEDRVAVCPMLSFGAQPMEFVLTFNTLDNMRERLEIKREPSEDTGRRKNLLSLFAGKWVCLTMVFEDNAPLNDFENGTVVRFYVNDTMYQAGRYSSALRQNTGDLCLFPDAAAVPQCKLASFVYFNYALSDAQVAKLAAAGPNTKPANVALPAALPYYVSDYNKLDMYNT